MSYLAEERLDAGGLLGAAIEHEDDLRRPPQVQPLRNLVPHIAHRGSESSKALGTRLLVSQHGDEYPRVGAVRAQVDASHRHKADARIFELAFNNLGNFTPDLIGKTVVPVCRGGHNIE